MGGQGVFMALDAVGSACLLPQPWRAAVGGLVWPRVTDTCSASVRSVEHASIFAPSGLMTLGIISVPKITTGPGRSAPLGIEFEK